MRRLVRRKIFRRYRDSVPPATQIPLRVRTVISRRRYLLCLLRVSIIHEWIIIFSFAFHDFPSRVFLLSIVGVFTQGEDECGLSSFEVYLRRCASLIIRGVNSDDAKLRVCFCLKKVINIVRAVTRYSTNQYSKQLLTVIFGSRRHAESLLLSSELNCDGNHVEKKKEKSELTWLLLRLKL